MSQSNHQKFVGMWVTADGHIRQELLPNGRYDEARGDKKSAYQGRYLVTGTHIHYWDDTGFEVGGDFIDGVLHSRLDKVPPARSEVGFQVFAGLNQPKRRNDVLFERRTTQS